MVMETRESSLLAGTINPGCSKITLSGREGFMDAETQEEANLAGALFAQQGWSPIMGLSSFLEPFKRRNHPSTTTKRNWVAGSHVKAELGQARSMFKLSGAETHPCQSHPGLASGFSIPVNSCELVCSLLASPGRPKNLPFAS